MSKTKYFIWFILLSMIFLGAKCPWEKDDETKSGSSGPPVAPYISFGSLVRDSSDVRYVLLLWEDYSNNEIGFEIYRSYEKIATIAGGTAAFEYEDYAISDYADYSYYVIAYNAAGRSARSNIVRVTVYPPRSPSELVAIGISAYQIKLTWKDNSTIENGFCIERKYGTEPYVEIDRVPDDSYTYTDYTATLDASYFYFYYYRVRAYNTAGYSNYANSNAVKTGGIPK